MKKGIVGFIFGFIAAIAGLFALIIKIGDKYEGFVDWIVTGIKDALNVLIYGENRIIYPKYSSKYTNHSYNAYAPYKTYNSYSHSYNYISKAIHNIAMVDFHTKKAAEEAKEKIISSIDKYGVFSIQDVYDLLGIDQNKRRYLDKKFGWMPSCKRSWIMVRKVIDKDIWYISMPDPVKLEEKQRFEIITADDYARVSADYSEACDYNNYATDSIIYYSRDDIYAYGTYAYESGSLNKSLEEFIRENKSKFGESEEFYIRDHDDRVDYEVVTVDGSLEDSVLN